MPNLETSIVQRRLPSSCEQIYLIIDLCIIRVLPSNSLQRYCSRIYKICLGATEQCINKREGSELYVHCFDLVIRSNNNNVVSIGTNHFIGVD